MTWKYSLINDNNGVRVIEKYGKNSYAELTEDDWWFENKEQAIEILEMIIKDLNES